MCILLGLQLLPLCQVLCLRIDLTYSTNVHSAWYGAGCWNIVMQSIDKVPTLHIEGPPS